MSAKPLDTRDGPVDNANQFGCEFRSAVFNKTALGVLRRKPGWVSIRFLRQLQMRDLAEMDRDGAAGARGAICLVLSAIRFAAVVARERHFFNAPVNARFLVSLKGGGLGLSEAGLDSAFGEDPSAAAGLHQQEFEAASTGAIANGGDLLAFDCAC